MLRFFWKFDFSYHGNKLTHENGFKPVHNEGLLLLVLKSGGGTNQLCDTDEHVPLMQWRRFVYSSRSISIDPPLAISHPGFPPDATLLWLDLRALQRHIELLNKSLLSETHLRVCPEQQKHSQACCESEKERKRVLHRSAEDHTVSCGSWPT